GEHSALSFVVVGAEATCLPGRSPAGEEWSVAFPAPPDRQKSRIHGLTPPCLFWWYHRPFWETTMYAVIETGGKQYRVTAGDTLEVERLETEAGKPHTFDRVLLVANDGKVSVGAPTLAGAKVVADVTQHLLGEKK